MSHDAAFASLPSSRSDLPELRGDDDPALSSTRQLFRAVLSNRLCACGFVVVAVLVLIAVFAPLIAPYNPIALSPHQRLLGPSLHHLFGTDEDGRDIFSRVVYGTRPSLLGAFGILAIGLFIGVPVGLVAGYAGKWIDEALMRVTDVFLSFPSLVLAVAVAVILGPSLQNAVLATGIVWWPWYARLVRGEVLKLKNQLFVQGSEAVGAGRLRIMFVHILRNSLNPLIVQLSLDVGYAILTLASLSFLGVGAQPPAPEWGEMISAGQSYYLSQWWYVTFPGLAILITVMAFSLAGDGLQEILSPQGRQ